MGEAIFYNYRKPQLKKGAYLVVGQVQSGKTRYMINKTFELYEDGFDVVILLCGSNNNLFTQTKTRFSEMFNRSKHLIIEVANTSTTYVPGDRRTLVQSLKTVDQISKVIDILENSKALKIAILDDESDYGGINIGKNEGSQIFRLIRKIYNSEIHLVNYYAVTATPFADVLAKDAFDFERIISLQPGIGYTGISFFSDNSIYHEANLDLVDKNDEIENSIIWENILVDHIRRIVVNKVKVSQILFNIDLASKYHYKLFDKLIKILKSMRKAPQSKWNDWFNDLDPVMTSKLIDELYSNLFVLNSGSNYWNSEANSIVIGGVLVSRGYTFPNLYTTVMLNEPKGQMAADVLLQRARWFGYRKSFFKEMKVFASSRTIEAYSFCNELVADVDKIIKNNNNSQSKLRNYLRTLKNDNVVLTRKEEKNGRSNQG